MHFCEQCGEKIEHIAARQRDAELSSQTEPATSTPYTTAASSRYKEAYLVARSIVGYGLTIRAVGFVIGLLVAAGIITIGSSIVDSEEPTVFVVLGVFLAAVIVSVFYFVSVFVCAQGQQLKASLDSAVYASPFLSDSEKAHVMSMKSTK